MEGLSLALCASLFWGVADFIGGLQSRRIALLHVLLVSQAIGLAVLLVVLVISVHGPPAAVRLVPAALAEIAGVAGLAAFYRALAIGTMSIVAPIAATGVCIPVVVGIAGGEHPASLQLAGIVATIAGVVLASREQHPDPGSAGARAARVSIVLALAAALGFGSFAVGIRSSAQADVLWALVASRAAGVAVLALAYSLRRPERGIGRTGLVPLTVMGILDLTATGAYAIATRHGLLSAVAVAASLYPLVTVTLARVLLGERVRRIQELGIAAALAGIAMIAAG